MKIYSQHVPVEFFNSVLLIANHWVLVYATGCGHVLFTSVDNVHTYLIDKPNGSTEDDAPASAYLKAVPNCTLTFAYTERGKFHQRKVVLLW